MQKIFLLLKTWNKKKKNFKSQQTTWKVHGKNWHLTKSNKFSDEKGKKNIARKKANKCKSIQLC